MLENGSTIDNCSLAFSSTGQVQLTGRSSGGQQTCTGSSISHGRWQPCGRHLRRLDIYYLHRWQRRYVFGQCVYDRAALGEPDARRLVVQHGRVSRRATARRAALQPRAVGRRGGRASRADRTVEARRNLRDHGQRLVGDEYRRHVHQRARCSRKRDPIRRGAVCAFNSTARTTMSTSATYGPDFSERVFDRRLGPADKHGQLAATFLDFGNGSDVDNIFLDATARRPTCALAFSDGSSRRHRRSRPPARSRHNVWHHYVATCDSSGNGMLYRDGQQVASGAIGTPADVAAHRQLSSPAAIGWRTPIFKARCTMCGFTTGPCRRPKSPRSMA